MYEAFYGLSGKPFQLNPDPAFYFGEPRARARLWRISSTACIRARASSW